VTFKLSISGRLLSQSLYFEGERLLLLVVSDQLWAAMGLYRYETAKLRGVIGPIVDLEQATCESPGLFQCLGGLMALIPT
jgi:hypothetical protein